MSSEQTQRPKSQENSSNYILEVVAAVLSPNQLKDRNSASNQRDEQLLDSPIEQLKKSDPQQHLLFVSQQHQTKPESIALANGNDISSSNIYLSDPNPQTGQQTEEITCKEAHSNVHLIQNHPAKLNSKDFQQEGKQRFEFKMSQNELSQKEKESEGNGYNFSFNKNKHEQNVEEINEMNQNQNVHQQRIEAFVPEPMDIEPILLQNQQINDQQNIVDDRKTADSVNQVQIIYQNQQNVENANQSDISSMNLSLQQHNSAADETAHTYFTHDHESLMRHSLPQAQMHSSISQNQNKIENRLIEVSYNENYQNSEANLDEIHNKQSENKSSHPASISSIFPNRSLSDFEYKDVDRKSLSIPVNETSQHSVSFNQQHTYHVDDQSKDVTSGKIDKIQEFMDIQPSMQCYSEPVLQTSGQGVVINLIKDQFYVENNQNQIQQKNDDQTGMRNLVIQFFDGIPKIIAQKSNNIIIDRNQDHNFISLSKIAQDRAQNSKQPKNLFAESVQCANEPQISAPQPAQEKVSHAQHSDFQEQNKQSQSQDKIRSKPKTVMTKQEAIDIETIVESERPHQIHIQHKIQEIPAQNSIRLQEPQNQQTNKFENSQMVNHGQKSINHELNMSFIESEAEFKRGGPAHRPLLNENQEQSVNHSVEVNHSEIQADQGRNIEQIINNQIQQDRQDRQHQIPQSQQKEQISKHPLINIQIKENNEITVNVYQKSQRKQPVLSNNLSESRINPLFNSKLNNSNDSLVENQDSFSFPRKQQRKNSIMQSNSEAQTQGLFQVSVDQPKMDPIQRQINQNANKQVEFLSRSEMNAVEEIWEDSGAFVLKSQRTELDYKYFQQKISPYINIAYIPNPKNAIGNYLYKNGLFAVALIKLVCRFDLSPFHAHYLYLNIQKYRKIQINKYIIGIQTEKIIQEAEGYYENQINNAKKNQAIFQHELIKSRQNELIKRERLHMTPYVYSHSVQHKQKEKHQSRLKVYSKQVDFKENDKYKTTRKTEPEIEKKMQARLIDEKAEVKRVDQTPEIKADDKLSNKRHITIEKNDKNDKNDKKIINDDKKIVSQDKKIINSENTVISQDKKVVNEDKKVVSEVKKDKVQSKYDQKSPKLQKMNILQEKYLKLKFGDKQFSIPKKDSVQESSTESNQKKDHGKSKNKSKKQKDSSIEKKVTFEQESLPQETAAVQKKKKPNRKSNKSKSKPKDESVDEEDYSKPKASKRH